MTNIYCACKADEEVLIDKPYARQVLYFRFGLNIPRIYIDKQNINIICIKTVPLSEYKIL